MKIVRCIEMAELAIDIALMDLEEMPISKELKFALKASETLLESDENLPTDMYENITFMLYEQLVTELEPKYASGELID